MIDGTSRPLRVGTRGPGLSLSEPRPDEWSPSHEISIDLDGASQQARNRKDIPMFRVDGRLTLALALIFTTTASAEATPPNGAPVQPPSALTVVCPADSIQAAVDRAKPGTPLTISVGGVCVEDVVIVTDDVTVQGNNIVDDHVIGGFTIIGAQRVNIRSLTIRDSGASYPVGVFATRGAAVVLDDVFVSGHGRLGEGGAGVYVNRNAHADIIASTVQNPLYGDNALLVNDGSVVRASDSTFQSANGAPNNGAAVGLFRSASARLDGTIFIENSAPEGGLAVQVLHTSNLRVQQGGPSFIHLINGDVVIGNNSAANIREFDVGGNILLERDSNLSLGGASDVIGTVTIGDRSLLALSESMGLINLNRGVTCPGGPAGGVINHAPSINSEEIVGCTIF